MTRTATSPLFYRVITLAVVLAAWEVVGRRHLLFGDALPPASKAVASLLDLLREQSFWRSVGQTVLQWAGGLIGSALVAIPVGLLIGSGRLRFALTRSTIDFLRTIPPVMLLPLFVLIWGTGASMVILLAIYAAVWPMLIQTISGVRAVDSLTLETARVFKIGPWRTFWKVLLPAVSPFVFSGLRVSAVISLFIAVVCELVAGSHGVGQLLTAAQLAGDAPGIYALIFVTGFLGLLINAGVSRVECRVLAWHPSQEKGVTS